MLASCCTGWAALMVELGAVYSLNGCHLCCRCCYPSSPSLWLLSSCYISSGVLTRGHCVTLVVVGVGFWLKDIREEK